MFVRKLAISSLQKAPKDREKLSHGDSLHQQLSCFGLKMAAPAPATQLFKGVFLGRAGCLQPKTTKLWEQAAPTSQPVNHELNQT